MTSAREGYRWSLKVLGEKYRWDQPRVPPGHPEGGQWTADPRWTGSQWQWRAAPKLKRYFDTYREAADYLELEAFRPDTGRRFWNSGTLSEEELIEVANTVKDIVEKTGKTGLVKTLTIQPGARTGYSINRNEVVINPDDCNPDVSERKIRQYIDVMKGSEDLTPLQREQIMELEAEYNSGEYKQAHTMYWFGGGGGLEAAIRHEYGHAFHMAYRRVSNRGGPGLDQVLNDPDWREYFAVTSRGEDNWYECIAENFVAWSVGMTDIMEPGVVFAFDRLTEK